MKWSETRLRPLLDRELRLRELEADASTAVGGAPFGGIERLGVCALHPREIAHSGHAQLAACWMWTVFGVSVDRTAVAIGSGVVAAVGAVVYFALKSRPPPPTVGK